MSTDAPDAEASYARLRDCVAARLREHGRPLCVLGVHTGGAWIAERLRADLAPSAPLGYLSSAFHRDDYAERGLPLAMKGTRIDFEVNDARILLVDDILYTGRTVRAALNEIFDYGRPASVELAVLLDRGGRQLPIQPDCVGAVHPLAADRDFVLERDADQRLSLRLERR